MIKKLLLRVLLINVLVPMLDIISTKISDFFTSVRSKLDLYQKGGE